MAVFADLKYSVRSLTRTPGLALALVLTVALGIGGNATVLGFIRGSITPNVPLSGIGSVVALYARDASGAPGPISYDRYLAIKARGDLFEWLGAARESQATVVAGSRSSIMSVAIVTPEVAALLQIAPGDGVVISDRTWRNDFDARLPISGEPIRIDGRDLRVTAVAPEWLDGLFVGRGVDIWMPFREETLRGFDRRSRTFWSLGRLRSAVNPRQVEEAMNVGISGSAGAIAVLPYSGVPPETADGMSRIARLLPAAAGAIFLIACANVAAFLLSRASARSHEMSVRVALGASRRQLARQLLADSLVVSVTGGLFGMLLAFWTARIIPALFFDQDARHLVFSLDVAGIAAASAVCVAVTVACGLMPLLEVRHDDPAAVLQRESSGPSTAMRRVRAGLVVMQMMCCCLLLITTALLFEGFREALRTRAASRLGQPILATLEARHRFQHPDLGLAYFRSAERAMKSLRGITATTWVGTLPGTEPPRNDMRIEPPGLPLRDVELDVAALTSKSLSHVVLPPLAGRMFAGRDTPEACKVVVVNKEAAAALFDETAVGRSITDPAGERVEIAGVVATRVTPGQAAPRPTIYYYSEQTAPPLDHTGPAMFRVPALPPPAAAVLAVNVVSANYFDAMGVSVVAGKMFTDLPPPHGCRAGVINQEAAELYFGGNAVGGVVIDGAGNRTTVVGVVRSQLLGTSQRHDEPAIYFPVAQDFRPRMTLILGAREANDALLESVHHELQSIEGGDPTAVTTLDAHLRKTALATERIATTLVSASAAIALTLGALGLYGAMGDSARRRRREIAVRLALGAQGWRVMRQLLAEGIRLAGAGTIAGLIGSLVAARCLARIAPGTGSLSVWMWIMAPLVLLAAVALASVVPVRRALAVEPITIMRDN